MAYPAHQPFYLRLHKLPRITTPAYIPGEGVNFIPDTCVTGEAGKFTGAMLDLAMQYRNGIQSLSIHDHWYKSVLDYGIYYKQKELGPLYFLYALYSRALNKDEYKQLRVSVENGNFPEDFTHPDTLSHLRLAFKGFKHVGSYDDMAIQELLIANGIRRIEKRNNMNLRVLPLHPTILPFPAPQFPHIPPPTIAEDDGREAYGPDYSQPFGAPNNAIVIPDSPIVHPMVPIDTGLGDELQYPTDDFQQPPIGPPTDDFYTQFISSDPSTDTLTQMFGDMKSPSDTVDPDSSLKGKGKDFSECTTEELDGYFPIVLEKHGQEVLYELDHRTQAWKGLDFTHVEDFGSIPSSVAAAPIVTATAPVAPVASTSTAPPPPGLNPLVPRAGLLKMTDEELFGEVTRRLKLQPINNLKRAIEDSTVSPMRTLHRRQRSF
jgi:hypothetical protein